MTDTPDKAARWIHLYRAKTLCTIGLESLDGLLKPPPQCSASDWAIYNLLSAVHSIAEALMEDAP